MIYVIYALALLQLLVPKTVYVDALEATWRLVFANNPQQKLITSLAIAIDGKSELLFILLMALELLGG
jgi:hypothetical protein